MKICTFFGHRDAPDHIKEKVRQAIISLIKEESVDCFYVGHNGNFDRMVAALLAELEKNIIFNMRLLLKRLVKRWALNGRKQCFRKKLKLCRRGLHLAS